MRKFIPEAFGLSSWGNSSVLDETVRTLIRLGISYKTADILDDLDTPSDIIRYKSQDANTYTRQYIESSGI